MARSNLSLRLLSAIFIMLPIIFLTWYSHIFAIISICMFCITLCFELLDLEKKHNKLIYSIIPGIVLLFIFQFISIAKIKNDYYYIYSVLLVIFFVLDNTIKTKYKFSHSTKNVFSVLFSNNIASYILLIINSNTDIFLYVVLISSVSDSSAFAFGKLFGKHKLAKNISPGKTIEGAIGGFASSVIIGSTVSLLVTQLSMLTIILCNFIFAFIAQLGDLVFSKIKRNRNIKDYGSIFPGHGGLIDRVDSSLFLFVISYFILIEWLKL